MLLWTLESSTCLTLSDYEGKRNEETRFFSMKHFQVGEKKKLQQQQRAVHRGSSGHESPKQLPIITPLIKPMKRKEPMPTDATNYNNNTAQDAREKSRLILLCTGEVKPVAANQAVKAK